MTDLFQTGAFPTVPLNNGNAAPPSNPMDIFQPNLYPTTTSMSQGGMNSQMLQALMPLMNQSIIPGLTSSINNLPNTAGQFMKSNAGGVLQDVMNKLGSRGMLNSSVASDAMSKAMTGLGGQAMQMQAGVPAILGQLLASTSGNMRQDQSFSHSSNPLEPYELLNNFVLNY